MRAAILALIAVLSPLASASDVLGCKGVTVQRGMLTAEYMVDQARKSARFKVSRDQAAREMSVILRDGYGARVDIDASSPARLRDIAELTMNNRVIAAQVLVEAAAQTQEFKMHPSGRAAYLMVSTATEPYEGDKELFDIEVKHAAEKVALADLYARNPFVRLALRASAFGDDVAERAAVTALCSSLQPQDRRRVDEAIERVRVRR